MLRPTLNMYCHHSKGGKCDRPSICADKVCAKTTEANYIMSAVGEFDDLLAKKLASEHIEFQTISAITVAGASVPSVIVNNPKKLPNMAPPVALPVFGAPFDGMFGVLPGAPTVTVTGTDSVAILCVDGRILAGTVFTVTYGTQKESNNVAVQVQISNIDSDDPYNDMVVPPIVTKSNGRFFDLLFPDDINSSRTCFSMFSICVTPLE